MPPVVIPRAFGGEEVLLNYGPLQVFLGCVLPLLAVASSIPIMMARRHVMYKDCLRRYSRIRRIAPTPRLPAVSVYMARLDYYLPTANTLGTISASGTRPSLDTGFTKSKETLHATPRSLAPELPLTSLPSLPSILCEFTAYADAIEPENLSDARRSSTLLQSSSSTKQNLSALGLLTLAPTNAASSHDMPKVPLGNHISPEGQKLEETEVQLNSLSDSIPNITRMSLDLPTISEVHPFFAGEPPAAEHWTHVGDDDPCGDMDKKALTVSATYTKDDQGFREDVQNTQFAKSITQCSLDIDTCDSWNSESLLSVRLSAFPAVPTFLPIGPLRGQPSLMTHLGTAPSMQSFITRTISAPASLKILELNIGPSFPHGLATVLRPHGYPSSKNGPGELWDEDDELKFSAPRATAVVCKPNKGPNMVRHTWAAGVSYPRRDDDIGELWDDEDDRRVSVAGTSEVAATLGASLSFLSTGNECSFPMSFSGFISAGGLSLIALTNNATASSETLQKSFSSTSCVLTDDAGAAFIKESVSESELTQFVSNFAPEDVSLASDKRVQSSAHLLDASWSSIHLDDLENLACRTDCSTLSLSESDCESARSSCMSLSSVLDIVIYEVDPAYSSASDLFRQGGSDPAFAIPSSPSYTDCADSDMELEYDYASYTSRIVWAHFPLVYAR